MYRRRTDLEIATRPNTEEAQQSVQSQRQNHNHATPADAVSCNSNRDSDFLRCLISFIKSMLVSSNVLPFHQVLKLLCNANWNMKTHPQLLMPLGLHGVLGEVAPWPAVEGWDPLQSSTTLNSIFHSDTRSIKSLQCGSTWWKHSNMYKRRHRITILQHQRMP